MTPPASRTRVNLEDLSDADRQKLLEQLRAEERNKAAADAGVYKRIGALMDSRDHLRDCTLEGRYEMYGATRPPNPEQGRPAQDVTVVRHVECGGSMVIEEPYEVVSKRLQEEADDTKE